MYVNASDRMWWRAEKEDYWQKELEALGQQEIENREVDVAHATPTGVFGYAPRYETNVPIRGVQPMTFELVAWSQKGIEYDERKLCPSLAEQRHR